MDLLQFLSSAEQAGSYVEKTLIAAIVTNPEDEIAVKAYGDYLEEHNRILAAMIVRGKGFSDKVTFAMRLLPNTQVTEVIASGNKVAELQGVGPGSLWLESHPNQNSPSSAFGSGATTYFIFQEPPSNPQYGEALIRSGQIGFGSVSSGGVY